MRLRLALALALALPVVVARPAGAQSDSAAVMAVITRLFDGMRTGDSAMVRTVFAPRARLISSARRQGKPVATVEDSPDAFVAAVGSPRREVWDERLDRVTVRVDDGLASVWADYGFFRGRTFSHCGIDHFLLTRNAAGAWQILELADTRRTEGCEAWTR